MFNIFSSFHCFSAKMKPTVQTKPKQKTKIKNQKNKDYKIQKQAQQKLVNNKINQNKQNQFNKKNSFTKDSLPEVLQSLDFKPLTQEEFEENEKNPIQKGNNTLQTAQKLPYNKIIVQPSPSETKATVKPNLQLKNGDKKQTKQTEIKKDDQKIEKNNYGIRKTDNSQNKVIFTYQNNEVTKNANLKKQEHKNTSETKVKKDNSENSFIDKNNQTKKVIKNTNELKNINSNNKIINYLNAQQNFNINSTTINNLSKEQNRIESNITTKKQYQQGLKQINSYRKNQTNKMFQTKQSNCCEAQISQNIIQKIYDFKQPRPTYEQLTPKKDIQDQIRSPSTCRSDYVFNDVQIDVQQSMKSNKSVDDNIWNYYKKSQYIRKGAYGAVYSGINILTQQKVAIKIIQHQNAVQLKQTQFEIKALQQINKNGCPYIIRLLDYQLAVPDKLKPKQKEQTVNGKSQFGLSSYLIFEYAPSNMREVNKLGEINPQTKKRWIYQLIFAVNEVHKLGIAHFDLKPQNILFDEFQNVKLADFGLCQFIDPKEPFKRFSDFPMVSLWYKPPQVLLHCVRHALKVDLWCVGMIIIQILKGKPLMKGFCKVQILMKILEMFGGPKQNTQLRHNLQDFELPELKNYGKLTIQLKELNFHQIDLINKLMQLQPTLRKDCSILIQTHEYFENFLGQSRASSEKQELDLGDSDEQFIE